MFERLARETHKQAYGLAYRLTGSAAEAEDLTQETFLRPFRFFDRYDESLSFASWVYRIMGNAHIDTMRRKGRIRTTSLDSAGSDGQSTWDLPDHEASPERRIMNGAIAEPIQAALNAMTPEFRQAVLLADVEGLAYEEVAEIMNTSVGTVRSRIHRGRKQIRQHLTRHAPEAAEEYSK